MTRILLSLALSGALVLPILGCDSDGNSGPLSSCFAPITPVNAGGKAIGERCTTNDECEYGRCIMPSEFAGCLALSDTFRTNAGLTNSLFGWCTRGCDCNETEDSNLSSEEKQTLYCLYPPGGTGDWRHVAPKCSSLDDCLALDAAYTECKATTCGSDGATKVCHAN